MNRRKFPQWMGGFTETPFIIDREKAPRVALIRAGGGKFIYPSVSAALADAGDVIKIHPPLDSGVDSIEIGEHNKTYVFGRISGGAL